MKKTISMVMVIAIVLSMFQFSFFNLTASAGVSDMIMGNVLWEANFDNETVRNFTVKDNYDYVSKVSYVCDQTASYGSSGGIFINPDDENDKVVKFTHTVKNISYSTWVELGASQANGIKTTGTNKILITEAGIYASSLNMNAYFYNRMWDGAQVSKAVPFEKNIPADKKVAGSWVIYKSVLDTSTGEFKLYLDGQETAAGTIDSAACTAMQTHGMWPQIRPYADGNLTQAEYMLIDYIKVGEPSETQPSPTASATATPSDNPSSGLLWEANFDNDPTGVLGVNTNRGTVNYFIDSSYGAEGEIIVDPSNTQSKLLKFIHNNNRVGFSTVVELVRAKANGIKVTGSNKVLTTEARIYTSSERMDSWIYNFYWNDSANNISWAFEAKTAAAKRVTKQWLTYKSVLNIFTGEYKVYLKGVETASGTITQEQCTAMQTNGMWPQLRAHAEDTALTYNAPLTEPEYMLIDYIKVFESEGALPEDNQKKNLPATSGPRFNLTEYDAWPKNHGDAHVALWNDDKKAAVTITIDDNWESEHSFWNSMQDKYGFPFTWFVITDRVTDWQPFNDLKARGHDIQSHTREHLNSSPEPLTEAQYRNEYAGSQQDINSNMPENKALTVAYPYGLGDTAIAGEYYISGRGVGGTPNKAEQTNYMMLNSGGYNDKYWVDMLFDPALQRFNQSYYKGWLSVLYHSVTMDNGTDDIRVATDNYLGYIADRKDELWVSGYTDVAKYGQERDSHTLVVTQKDNLHIKFNLTDMMDDTIFNYPLTVKVRINDSWKNVSAKQDGNTVECKIIEHDGGKYALVKAVPDKGIVELLPDDYVEITMDDIKYFNGAADITSTGLVSGLVSAKITFKNNVTAGASAKAVVALYNGTKLEGIDIIPVALTAGAGMTEDSKVFNIPSAGNYKIKIFLWDELGTMAPYQMNKAFEAK